MKTITAKIGTKWVGTLKQSLGYLGIPDSDSNFNVPEEGKKVSQISFKVSDENLKVAATFIGEYALSNTKSGKITIEGQGGVEFSQLMQTGDPVVAAEQFRDNLAKHFNSK